MKSLRQELGLTLVQKKNGLIEQQRPDAVPGSANSEDIRAIEPRWGQRNQRGFRDAKYPGKDVIPEFISESVRHGHDQSARTRIYRA